MTRSFAMDLRSAMLESDVRLYFFAVSALSVTVSLSSAAAGSSSVSLVSSLALIAAVVAARVAGVAFGSR
jgi:hypothetical protein